MGVVDDYKPAIVMIFVQSFYAGTALLSAGMFSQGIKSSVFVVYRQAFAFLFMAPVTYFARGASYKYSLEPRSFGWIFMISLIGISLNHMAYYKGLELASSTIASAMANLVPGLTFVMAAIVGLEKVDIRSSRSNAKILGTIVCVGGAVSMALIKGPKLLNVSIGLDDRWLTGCLLEFFASCCWSFWLILQTKVVGYCPDPLLLTTWMCFLGSIQSAIFVLISEQDVSVFKLRSGLEYLEYILLGLAFMGSVIGQGWSILHKGPLFCALFNPLCTVIVAIFSVVFLHDAIYTGSLVGAFAVIIGLYVVLWGKAEDVPKILQSNQDLRIYDDPDLAQSYENFGSDIDLERPLLLPQSSVESWI